MRLLKPIVNQLIMKQLYKMKTWSLSCFTYTDKALLILKD